MVEECRFMFGFLFIADIIRKTRLLQKIHDSHIGICLLFADNASRELTFIIGKYCSNQ